MTQPTAPAVLPADRDGFCETIRSLAAGVAVVTTTDPSGAPEGMTVSSLTSVSLDPLLVLVCLVRESRTARAAVEAGGFIVNLLAEDQREVSLRFARPGQDHFADVPTITLDGMPGLVDCLGHLVCDLHAAHPGGDHVILVGRVQACGARPGNPLLYFDGQYRTLA